MFALVEYGSAVRGVADEHSDRDLLIVCDRRLHLYFRKRYESLGYSVSTLTAGQLNSMHKRGSLFIQHLKRESRILYDMKGCFHNWIKECQMVKPTIDEIERCIDSLEFSLNWPDDPCLTGWRADFVYCLSRDFLIKRLAMESRLVFGLDDIQASLQETGVFPSVDLDVLRRLREVKSAYRAGFDLPSRSKESLGSWLMYLACGLGLSKRINRPLSVEQIIARITKRNFSSAYEQLRSLEGLYLVACSRGIHHPAHESLVKFISAPNAYGSSQIRKQRKTAQYLADVLSLLVNKGLNQTGAPPLRLDQSVSTIGHTYIN